MTVIMTLPDFEAALDLHGSDLSRWPEALRRPAAILLERNATAREALHRTERLEALVRRAAAPEPLPAATLGKLLDGLARRRARAGENAFFLAGPRSVVAAGLAAFLVFGLGALTGSLVDIAPDQVELALMSLGDSTLLEFY